MKNEIVIKANKISKMYKLYKSNSDRVKEAFSFIKKKKYHKDFYALNNISFEVKKGESLGIIGRNGAGKSTLLKILTGVLTPTSGKYYVNGKISALIELGAGFNPEFTGVENIYFNGSIMGYTKEEMSKLYDEIVDFADIGDYIYQPVKTYSSGMFVRLAFSVATTVNPDILIVDEALSVGDMFFQAKCANRMKKLLDGDTTLLFVSHNVSTVKSLCEKSILLDKGKIIEYGKSDDVVEKYFQMKVESDKGTIPKKLVKNNPKQSKLLKDNVKIQPLKKFSIDRINNERFRDKETILLNKNDENVIIEGWAIDFDNKDVGEGLFFEIGDNIYEADYGLERNDVAQVYGHYDYTNSGFRIYIPVEAFENEYKDMYIKLKAKDSDIIYSAKISKKILISETLSGKQKNELSINENSAFQKRASYNRIQNGKAEFINVQLLDEKGNEITLVEYDQKVTLRMSIKTHENIDELTFGYHIRNQNGIDIVYTDSAIENKMLTKLKKDEIIIIDIEFNMPLAEGKYNFATVLSIPIDLSISKVDFCDFIPLSYQFIMNKRKPTQLYGLVHWNNNIKIERNVTKTANNI